MDVLIKIFREGNDLTFWRMGDRGIVVFFIAYLFMRLSGGRPFGIKTPLDKIIAITLGAVPSRAVVGASDFVPVVFTGFLIVVLDRLLEWSKVKSPETSQLIDSEKILPFNNGRFINENLDKRLSVWRIYARVSSNLPVQMICSNCLYGTKRTNKYNQKAVLNQHLLFQLL